MAELTKSLNNLLANTYALFLKTQNYHWNVVGPQFHSLHALFEEEYSEYFSAIDEIAERIRALGDKPQGSFAEYQPLLQIKEASGNENAQSMLKELAGDQDTIIQLCNEAMELAKGDEATTDMLIARTQVHQKNKWMLESSMA